VKITETPARVTTESGSFRHQPSVAEFIAFAKALLLAIDEGGLREDAEVVKVDKGGGWHTFMASSHSSLWQPQFQNEDDDE